MIGKFWKIIEKRIMILKNLIRNMILYKRGNLSYFEYKIKKMYYKKNQQFGGNIFYQSYPPLNIRGVRPTLSRIRIYEIEKYINREHEILDIGGNIGFFSIYLSDKVKHIDIIEKNKTLVEIGRELKNYKNIKNVNFINIDFKSFHTEKKYDIIFSFAVHKWVGIDFIEYLSKIHDLLKNDGILLIESQDILQDNLKDKLNSLKSTFKEIDHGTIDDHMGLIRKFYYLKKK